VSSPWRQLCALDGYRITEIPRRPGTETTGRSGAAERDPGRAQRLAALVAAYHVGGAVAFGWLRNQAGGAVQVLVAGSALAGSTVAGEAVLALPGGARGRVLGTGALARAMSGLSCWRAIGGISDGLLVSARERQPDRDWAVPSLEECLLPAWPGPFGWIVIAEPVSRSGLEKLADETAHREVLASNLADRFPDQEVEARRLRHRHAELRQGHSAGFWRVHLLAGGADPMAAARVAGLVCASADLNGLPYTLAPGGAGAAGLRDLLDGHPSGHPPAPGAECRPGPGVEFRPGPGPGPGLGPGPSPSAGTGGIYGPGEDQSDGNEAGGTGEALCPFHAGTELLAALARAPEAEIPGLRLALRPEFDVTPESAAVDSAPDGTGAISLGEVLDRQRAPAGALSVPLASLNRHVFVCGATGGGKSQTVRGLLEAATEAGVPWLVIEPAKSEYRLMAARLASARPAGADAGTGTGTGTGDASMDGDRMDGTGPVGAGSAATSAPLTAAGTGIVRIRPGEADAIAVGLNPLEPASDEAGHRFPLQTHADLVRALFLAAFDSDEPFPQVLSAALNRAYEDAGWDLALNEPVTEGLNPRYPGLADLQRTAERVVLDIGYGDDLSADVLGYIRVRLSSLRLGTTGRFLEGGHPIDVGRLLRRNVVLEIEDVGDDHDKAFLMGIVLIRLVEHLRLVRRHEPGGISGRLGAGLGGEPGLRHLTVFEEAHRLLRRPDREGGPAAHAVELFAGLLAEIRAYGEGIVIAEQIPAKLIPDVIKNTAVKIAHRLPAEDDREAVGATMNMTRAQSRYLVTLAPGEAAVAIDGMDHPLLARMPDGTAREAAAIRTGAATSGAGASGGDLPAVTVAPASTAEPSNGTAQVADNAGGIASVRSTTCGVECVVRPCTLRDMRAAQRALERHPGIALWAELCVLSHLTGWVMPVPRRPLLDLLRVMPVRLRDCALSHGVDAAVASRAPVISSRVSTVSLASHVNTAMRARVARGMWMCLQEEPKWLAPAYEWVLVLDVLRSADRKHPGAGRHPRTGDWERLYGRTIAGDTCARQAGTVQRWYDADQRDAEAVRGIAFGLGSPSVIERAAGARVTDDDFEQQMASHLEQFVDCRWPMHYLTGASSGQATRKL